MARHSLHDSEAYERYSRDVTRQCRFIQPLLMRTAPDPASLRIRAKAASDTKGFYQEEKALNAVNCI